MPSINNVDRQGGGGSKMSILIYKGEGGSMSNLCRSYMYIQLKYEHLIFAHK